MDCFAGSNTTGAAAEAACRRWLAFELESEYLATSAFRFLTDRPEPEVLQVYEALHSDAYAGIQLPQNHGQLPLVI